MDNLTSFRPFATFPSGLGQRAGKLSLEATKMSTRILSVFSLLKRVGFAVLLLGRSIEAAVIENSTEDIMKKSMLAILWVLLLLCALPCHAQLLYGTYLGGNNLDACYVVSPTPDGGVYVAGSTNAMSGFPTTPGVYDETGVYPGRRPFCSHFGPDGEFIASTLYGHLQTPEDPSTSGGAASMFLVYDSVHSALWMAGVASEEGWPLTPDAFDTVIDDEADALLMRFSADLTTIEYCTYLGGNSVDVIRALVMGDDGRLYAAGETWSPDFPVTPDALYTYQGWSDCFLWVFDPDAQEVVFSTYLGGSGADDMIAGAMQLDTNGVAWVMGRTRSTDLPVTENAFQLEYAGISDDPDVLLAGISIDPPTLEYCSYLGGAGLDEAYSLAVEESLVWLAGRTASPDFPVSLDAYDTTFTGMLNERANAFASSLNWRIGDYRGTFFSWSGNEQFSRNKNWVQDSTVTLVGGTTSDDLPITGDAYQAVYRGELDGFVVKLNRALTNLLYCSYVGGGHYDSFNASYVENPDSLWMIGTTESIDFPTTPNAIQPGDNGLLSGFVVHFAIDTMADTTNAAPQPFVPDDFSFNVYPNPFNPVATLSFTLPKASHTQLFIHDMLGRLVESKDFARLDAGAHEVQVDGSNWATGLYFATISANNQTRTQKLLLLK